MTLLVDCGNTRIKWAIATADGLAGGDSVGHRDDPASAIARVADAAAGAGGSACVASVLSAGFTDALVDALERVGCAVDRVVASADAHGLRVAYAEPTELGVDRWLAMIAAMRSANGAVCALSAGTAVTFDAVDAGGRHLGGFIWPGAQMAATALAANTDRIGTTPLAAGSATGIDALGRSTAEAVGRGSLFALAAAIDHAVKIVAEATGEEPGLIATGGDAPALAPWLETTVQFEPDLVLDGLRIVAASTDSTNA